MTAFLLAAGLLVALTLLLLLVPLLRRRVRGAEGSRQAINAGIYRDQLAELERDYATGSLSRDDYEESRAELARRLLEDVAGEEPAARTLPARRSAWVLGLALPLAAALLYLTLGNVPALSPEATRAPKVSAQDIEQMVARLAARLESDPQADPKGWLMLARSYKAMGRYEESTRAFEKAGHLVETDPHLLSDYAEALALATGGSLRGRPSELIARALELDPDFPDALVLAGTAAYEREDYAAAVAYWERLLRQLPPDSEDAAALSASLDKARAAAKKRAARPAGRTAR